MSELPELIHSGTYYIDSHRFKIGVYDSSRYGFLGIRRMYGTVYLGFTLSKEVAFGSAVPKKFIMKCPVENLNECIMHEHSNPSENATLIAFLEELHIHLGLGKV